VQLQVEYLCLAFAEREPRRKRLNPIKEFEIALLARLDEVHGVREILPGREPTYLEPAGLIGFERFGLNVNAIPTFVGLARKSRRRSP
jgi:hypothetical protein